jgi:hypothetical protein
MGRRVLARGAARRRSGKTAQAFGAVSALARRSRWLRSQDCLGICAMLLNSTPFAATSGAALGRAADAGPLTRRLARPALADEPAGKPFAHLKYCVRCCIPQTQEGVVFDELGVCQACQSAEQKIHIDWTARERALRAILDEAKAKAGNNYDCIIPISGGKDSTFQLYVLTQIYGMKPLAVTFSHNWYSETGWYNLVNSLEQFDVDHIMFTPNR